jgi:signal peptidase II
MVTYRRTLLGALLVIVLDQITKIVVRNTIEIGRVIHIFPGISLTHVSNTGASFGAFGGNNFLLIIITIAIITGIVAYVIKSKEDEWTKKILILIAAGACGNVIDRIMVGHVTDFLTLPYWPSFNIADSVISLSVIVLIIHSLKGKTEHSKQK